MITYIHTRSGAVESVPEYDVFKRDYLLAAGWIETEQPQPAPQPLPQGWEMAIDTFDELAPYMNMIRLLIDAGYDSPDDVRFASDEELLAIKGIGPKSLGALRTVLGVG